jgi:8-oxo-dGTP diphosphatase
VTERRAFSVATFARHRGRILLIRHRRLGTWLPPGGEIMEGETPLEAARRELFEETGLTGRFDAALGVDGTPPGYLGYEEHLAGSKGRHLNFAFLADVDTDEVVPNHEFDAHRWVEDPGALDCPRNVVELGRMALAASGSPLVHLARRWLAAVNAHDLEALLALYAEDAVHACPGQQATRPETGGEVRGRAALREWWADTMQRLPGLCYEERHLSAAGDRVLLELVRQVPGEAPRPVAEVLVFGGGLIRASRLYHG